MHTGLARLVVSIMSCNARLHADCTAARPAAELLVTR